MLSLFKTPQISTTGMLLTAVVTTLVARTQQSEYEIEKWVAGENIPEGTSSFGMVLIPDAGLGAVVMVTTGGSSNSVFMYDVDAGVWSSAQAMPDARYGHGMVFIPATGTKGKVMVAGGHVIGGELLDSVIMYDVDGGAWSYVEPMPESNFYFGIVFCPGGGGGGAL